MTSPRPLPSPGRRLTILPPVGENVPGWRIARRSVSIVLLTMATLGAAAITASFLVAIDVTIDGSGILEPASVWPIRSAESGILAEVLVRTGDTVRAGQPMARLDTTFLHASVAELEAQIAGARVDGERLERSKRIDELRLTAAVEAAEARIVRARTTLRQHMAEFQIKGDADSLAQAVNGRIHVGLDGPSADLLAARADLASARAQLASVELATFDARRRDEEVRRLTSQVIMSRKRLARLVVRAPASGVVLTEQPERMVGSSIREGDSFMELGDLNVWRAIISVHASDVHRIHAGDPVMVEITALAKLPEDRVRGRVISVAWQPVSAFAVAGAAPAPMADAYAVFVAIDSGQRNVLDQGLLRRGYVVHGKIVTKRERAIMLLRDSFRERTRQVER